jgi:hypothetical protein
VRPSRTERIRAPARQVEHCVDRWRPLRAPALSGVEAEYVSRFAPLPTNVAPITGGSFELGILAELHVLILRSVVFSG